MTDPITPSMVIPDQDREDPLPCSNCKRPLSEHTGIVCPVDPVPSKDRVSLDDLRRAIMRYENARDDGEIRIEIEWQRYGEAWRTAFEWLHKGEGVARCGDAYVVGLMLIERLP